MRALAAWVMARRSNSLVATSGFAASGVIFPSLLVMSLACVGLVTMRRGAKEGLIIVLACVALFGLVAMLVTQTIRADLIILAVLWLMTWVIAIVYRQMSAAAWMINAAGVIGLLCVAGIYLVIADPAALWLSMLEQHLKPLFVQQQLLPSDAELDKFMMTLAKVLTGGMAALISVVLIVSMLLARWWQAMLYNPGGFRQEFHALRLGRVTTVVMILLIVISLVGKYAITADMATVVWLLFFFQGMAVIHSLIGMTGMGVGWLVSLYLLLAVVPNYASPVISGLGLVDTWFDFRRRVPRKSKPDNSDNVE